MPQLQINKERFLIRKNNNFFIMRKSIKESNSTSKSKFLCTLTKVETSTKLPYLIEGDVMSADMVTDEADMDLTELFGFADSVSIAKRYDEDEEVDVFDINITVEGEDNAQSLYDWLYANKYAESDDEIEEMAPGLIAYINGEGGEELAADEMPAEEGMRESVSARFSKYRKISEGEEIAEDEMTEGDADEDEKKDDEEKPEEKDNDDDDKEEGDEEEEVPMTAIIIEVAKGDEDSLKDELIDAGIDEDYIEIIEPEEGDDVVQVKVAPDAIMELKTYLDGKGIDLEEKIGGKIVDDSEEGEDSEDNGEETDGENGDENPEDKPEDYEADLFGENENE